MDTSYISIIDILGTFSFAAAGSFAAMEKRLDPFGVLIIAFVTAIGGGTIRDLLIGDLPVAWLTNASAIFAILLATVSTMFFGGQMKKLHTMLFLFDAIGLGLFSMIGIQKGMMHGLGTGICIMLGTITGCFGGVLRDVLVNNVPLIFEKEIYALASIMGGALFFVLLWLGMTVNVASVIGIIVVFLIRILAVRYNWSLPRFYESRRKEP